MTTIKLKDYKYHRDTWVKTYLIWCKQRKTIGRVDPVNFTITFEDDMMATIFMIHYPHNR